MGGLSGLSGWSGPSGLTGLSSDWFVDSVNGSDANQGNTAAGAFQTLAAVVAAGIAANDQIALATGSHWDEQLGSLPNGVRVVSYGGGAKPVLDCSDPIPNASFAATGGTANVYDVSLTNDNEVGAKTHHSVWEDDVRLVEAANLAACDATAGSYFIANHAANPMTLYVHATDSSNVTTNGKLYEWSHRAFGLDLPTSGYARGIVTRRNGHNDGSLRIGNNATVLNCDANEGSFHNLYIQGGATLRAVTATDAYWAAGSHAYFVVNEDDGANRDVTFDNCQALKTGAYDTTGTGFNGHTNVGPDPFGIITFQSCSVQNMNKGFTFVAGAAATAVYNDCSTDDVQFSFESYNPDSYTGCSIANTGAGLQVRGISAVAAISVSIDGLTVSVPNVSGGAVYTAVAATISLTNSTIRVTASAGVRQAVFNSNAGATLTLTGNTYGGNMVRVYNFTAVPTYTSDFNTFEQADADMVIGGATYNNIADYQTGTGQDAHSTV